ncbi:hypothetical protein ES703_123804 [subsurface metagenome]
MERVLMVGLGDVGTKVLEILARDPRAPQLIVGDVDEEVGVHRVNNAVIGAAHHGLHPHFHFRKVDLNDIKGTAQLIKELNPDAVINCAVMQTWHLIRQLPYEIYSKISAATLGAWLPVQLTLALKLAQAIQISGVKTYYINTSLSCLTNPVLGKLGLAPTIGIGNVDLIAPAIQTLVANELKVPRSNITIYLVAHHVHWVYPREAGYREGAPYYLKVMLGDKDITNQFDKDRLMYDGVKLYPPGLDFTTVSASSTIKNLMALLYDTGLMTHSPAPNGLPGGYPVRLSAKGAEVVLPEELTLEQAIGINEEAQRYDGVERIEEDGTVVFTDYTVQIMKEMIGFDCLKFKPDEIEARAREQISLYRKLEKKYLG